MWTIFIFKILFLAVLSLKFQCPGSLLWLSSCDTQA